MVTWSAGRFLGNSKFIIVRLATSARKSAERRSEEFLPVAQTTSATESADWKEKISISCAHILNLLSIEDRIKTEEKTKVVAAVWGTYIIG